MEGGPPVMQEQPENTARTVRKVTDFAQLKAMSHPTRMRMLTLMSNERPYTVSEIATALGESAGTISYHLRQLEKAGVVMQVPSPDGDGRKSCWQAVGEGYELSVDAKDASAVAQALDQAGAEFLRAGRERYRAAADSLPAEWRDPGCETSSVILLTAEEYAQMSAELLAVTRKWTQRNLTHREGDGSQPVMLATELFKWIP